MNYLLGCAAAVLAATLVFQSAAVGAEGSAPEKKNATWTYEIDIPMPAKNGQPQPPGKGYLWLPEGVKVVRGLFYPGTIVIGSKLSTDPVIRETLASLDMGLVYFKPGLGLTFIQGGGERLESALAELARVSGHPEVEFAPMLTAGHSTDGIFCRNVAYWKPHRVIGVLMLKSGNFHHHIEDLSRSLAGVPLTMISGEFEEYGPEGGDLGSGLRSEYSLNAENKKKRNQTQWVMARMQMLGRRAKNPDNLWSLIVHHEKGHVSWDDEVRDLAAAFIRSCAKARIPKMAGAPTSEVHCVPLKAEDGWLYDADIKNPKHKPAPYAEYTGEKKYAFWVPDQALAEAIWAYHNKGWTDPDPTADLPPEERFAPPPLLRDLVDSPAPKPLTWKGGDGTWTADGKTWDDGGKAVAWDPKRQAVIPAGSTVRLGEDIECAGLVLEKGATLDIGTQTLRARWHAKLAEGSWLRIRVDGTGERATAGRVRVEGNLERGGTLVVEPSGEFPRGGKFGVLGAQGLKTGEFSHVAMPEGWETTINRGELTIVVPKPEKK